MRPRTLSVLLILAGCAKQPDADLQYIKQARSLTAQWALVNEQAQAGRLTTAYVNSMHQWLHDGLQTAYESVADPGAAYAIEVKVVLTQGADDPPAQFRAHADKLKQLETELE